MFQDDLELLWFPKANQPMDNQKQKSEIRQNWNTSFVKQ